MRGVVHVLWECPVDINIKWDSYKSVWRSFRTFNTAGFILGVRIGRGMILIKALMKLVKSIIPLPCSSFN